MGWEGSNRLSPGGCKAPGLFKTHDETHSAGGGKCKRKALQGAANAVPGAETCPWGLHGEQVNLGFVLVAPGTPGGWKIAEKLRRDAPYSGLLPRDGNGDKCFWEIFPCRIEN